MKLTLRFLKRLIREEIDPMLAMSMSGMKQDKVDAIAQTLNRLGIDVQIRTQNAPYPRTGTLKRIWYIPPRDPRVRKAAAQYLRNMGMDDAAERLNPL